MSIKVTYYLEVLSSWCYWAEPAWAELKQRYAGKVEFGWKIAQMPLEAYPVSVPQLEWVYRRSGTIMRSPFMLNTDWFQPGELVAQDYVAEAAKDLGVTDDCVRLAISHAGVREGKKVGDWDVAATVAAEAGRLDRAQLLARAKSPEIAARVAVTTKEFYALQVTQRPTFLLESPISDRAVFSGIVRIKPIAATLDVMLADEAAYASWKAHVGNPPTS